MIEETLHAAHWWVQRISSYEINVEAPSWQTHFEKVMTELLRAKYHSHWYPNKPSRGSGYRAISNEYSLDPILDKAAQAVSHSLHKYLAQMVLMSEDRWLVMFVNPGNVVVRNKRNSDTLIYDHHSHIFNKSLRKRSLRWDPDQDAVNRKLQKSKDRLSASSMLSKSDDDTLGTVDENKSNDDPMAKSDPEDIGGRQVDYKKLLMDEVHKKARKIKELEIAKHVEDFKEEMRLNHRNAARWHRGGAGSVGGGTTGSSSGAASDCDDRLWAARSPSKSSAGGTTSTRSSASSRSSRSPLKSPSAANKKGAGTKEVAASPTQQSHREAPTPNGNSHSAANALPPAKNGQILNVLNTLNIEKLQNGLSLQNNLHRRHHLHRHDHHHRRHRLRRHRPNHPLPTNNGLLPPYCAGNGIGGIDCGGNYGQHLAEILNSCRIHSRTVRAAATRSPHKEHQRKDTESSPRSAASPSPRAADKGYPVLFPTSFASPSVSPTATAPPSAAGTPRSASFASLDEPEVLRVSKSEPFGAIMPPMNGCSKLQKMKSLDRVVSSLLDYPLTLNTESVSDGEGGAHHRGSVSTEALSSCDPQHFEGSEASSEIASHRDGSCASEHIQYESATPPTNDSQHVSPSSNGSRSELDEELKC